MQWQEIMWNPTQAIVRGRESEGIDVVEKTIKGRNSCICEVLCILFYVGTGINDLTDVLTALDPVAHKWRSIGQQLGMKYSTLESIQYDYRSTRDCFVAMSRRWLQMSDPPPTWSDLVRVLSSSSVREKWLADTIMQMYCQQDEEQLTSPTPGAVSRSDQC